MMAIIQIHLAQPPLPPVTMAGMQHAAAEALVTMSFGFLTLLMLSGPSSAMAVGYGVAMDGVNSTFTVRPTKDP